MNRSKLIEIVVLITGVITVGITWGSGVAFRGRNIQSSYNYSDNLNKEYSPSMWSQRFLNGIDVEKLHIEFVTEESERVRQKFNYETISYGDSFNDTYDIYGTELPADAPVFVYIHGGYWQMLDKNISAYCVAPLVTAGIKVIVVGYDLCPTVTLAELVEQITKFGEFLLKSPDYTKSQRIILAGHSAGAHLVVCLIDKLLTKTSKPLRIDTIYLISGVYDLSELQFTNNNEHNILSINDGNVDRLSPLKFDFTEWQRQQITIRIYVGQFESPTFIRQSLELYLKLSNVTSGINIQVVQGYDHFQIVEDLSLGSYDLIKQVTGSNGSSVHIFNAAKGLFFLVYLMGVCRKLSPFS